MKKYLLLCLSCLLFFSKSGHAQKEFAPLNAEWYHDMQLGIFHSTVTSDTVIKGIPCRKIDMKAIIKASGTTLPESNYQYYVYDNVDTVFIYNRLFNRFTPLYIFNVNDGDTVCIPAPPVEVGEILDYAIDTNFCFIVDSVRMKDWDKQALKTVYTRSYDRNTNTEAYPNFSFGGEMDSQGVYVERIGSVEKGFLPSCWTCGFLLSESYQPIGALRCYVDNDEPEYAVKLEDTCDKGVPTHIEDIPEQTARIYPNPSDQQLNIIFSAPLPENSKWTISDISGREMKTGILTKGSMETAISLPYWSQGMYFLKVNIGKELLILQKISISR